MNDKFPHQSARVIGLTEPEYLHEHEVGEFDYIGPMTSEAMIPFCAKVSNPSGQGSGDNARLMNYLRRNAHWSPFEMVSVTMEVNTTRDIARQLLRHRSFSFQEFSQRYSEVTELEDFVMRDARRQDEKNRQNSIDDMLLDDVTWFQNAQKNIAENVKQVYAEALKRRIAKEQARSILPEGMTPSRLYVNGTLRSWFHYVDLREKNGTQLEHMDLALKCKDAISEHYPSLFAAEETQNAK